MSGWRLQVKNYKRLENIDWAPEGVCLLAGANGAGKTTLLEVIRFLQRCLKDGQRKAMASVGGPAGLRHINTKKTDDVTLSFESGGVEWKLWFPFQDGALSNNVGEQVWIGERCPVDREPYQRTVVFGEERREIRDADKLALSLALMSGHFDDSDKILELTETLQHLIGFDSKYDLDYIAAPHPAGTAEQLDGNGRNLASVLLNWKGAPRTYEGRFEWVVRSIKLAFPDILEDLEVKLLGQHVMLSFFPPGSKTSLPLSAAASGVITGLLHLVAVAGAARSSTLAIEDMANHLHPHAIRELIRAIRERAEEFDLTIIITTHSPFLMNEFKEYPDQFYVLDAGEGPTPLDELHDPDWLAHFSFGDLYSRGEFAAPRKKART